MTRKITITSPESVATVSKATHVALFNSNPPKRKWWQFWKKDEATLLAVLELGPKTHNSPVLVEEEGFVLSIDEGNHPDIEFPR